MLNASDKRQRARAALGQHSPAEIKAELPTGDADDTTGHDRCEVCGRKLVLIAKIPRPPPRSPPWRRSTLRSAA